MVDLLSEALVVFFSCKVFEANDNLLQCVIRSMPLVQQTANNGSGVQRDNQLALPALPFHLL